MRDRCLICKVELNDGEHVYRAPTGYGGHIFCHIECVKRKIESGERIFVRTITVDLESTATMDIGDADKGD